MLHVRHFLPSFTDRGSESQRCSDDISNVE